MQEEGDSTAMIDDLWKKHKDRVLDLRRRLHRYPETALQETYTAKVLEEFLLLYPWFEARRAAGTGVVASLAGGAGPGRTMAVRSEMDALQVTETTGLPFTSERPGYMHACGHDAHMAMAAGAAVMLADMREQWAGTVRFLFQPAEEQIGGAKPMIEAGVLADPPVEGIMALHLFPDLPLGKAGFLDGPIMASNDRFRIVVRGSSAHAATPERGIDPVLVAAQIVVALQTVITREMSALESVVISFGICRAGQAYNIIPGEAELEGTVRTLNPLIRDQVAARMAEIVEKQAAVYGAQAELEYVRQYPVTVNDASFNRIAARAAAEVLGKDGVIWLKRPSMMAEDFSFFLERVPGAMIFLGSGSAGGQPVYPLHHGSFQFDEQVLEYGTKLIVRTVLNFLDSSTVK